MEDKQTALPVKTQPYFKHSDFSYIEDFMVGYLITGKSAQDIYEGSMEHNYSVVMSSQPHLILSTGSHYDEENDKVYRFVSLRDEDGRKLDFSFNADSSMPGANYSRKPYQYYRDN